MCKILKAIGAGIAFVVILTIGLAGCSSDVSQNQSSSSGQQQPSSSGQQPAGSPGQQPPSAPDMNAILNRAAEILGISTDEFAAAFQNAMPEDGPPGPGQQGQPPVPPSDQQGQQPPAPPSGEQGQPPAPPSGQQMSQSPFMAEVCAKMAAELNIPADDIANAMAQAEKELQK